MATKARVEVKKKRPRLPVPAGCLGLLNVYQVGDALGGMCGRTVRRMVAAGEFPKPDLVVRGRPLWKVASFNAHVEGL